MIGKLRALIVGTGHTHAFWINQRINIKMIASDTELCRSCMQLYIICLRRMFAYPENIARSQLMVSLSLQSTQNLEMQWLWLRKKCDRIEMIIATVNIANAHLLGHLSVVRCRIQRILLSRTLQMVYMGRCCSWTWHSVWAIRSGSEKTEKKKTTIEENAEN